MAMDGYIPAAGGLCVPELILVAAIVVLLTGASLLPGLKPTSAAAQVRGGAGEASARAYLDRVIGPAGGAVRPLPVAQSRSTTERSALWTCRPPL